MEYNIVINGEWWSVVTDDSFPEAPPDGYGSPDLGHDFCYLDTKGIAQTYLLVALANLDGRLFYPFRPQCYGSTPFQRWVSLQRFVLLTTSDDAGQLGFYTATMREHNIVCRRMSCWKTICDPTLPEGRRRVIALQKH